MPSPVPFLTATWSRLALFNYAVPGSLLTPHLPPSCTPDTSLDGRAYVSLVAFDFLDCRVLGIPWPGFRNFPEVNLRAYVRSGHDRGVTFIREIVPSRTIAAIARLTYNEPYLAARMSSRSSTAGDELSLHHHIHHAGRDSHIHLTADATPKPTPTGGPEHHFKEHRWGFNTSRRGRLLRYEVVHDLWNCHPIRSHTLDVDFAALFGPAWAPLATRPPDSALLAEGSPIAVHLWRTSRP